MENLITRIKKTLLWALAFLAGACQLDNAGSVRNSPEVAAAFGNLQLQGFQGFRYYFLNQENSPFGVAGLASPYWLQGPDWKECDPDSPVFKKVVGLVQSFPVPGSRTEGFTLLDRQGRPIGVWYSSLAAGVTVDPESKKVMIATATPWRGQ